jgi:ribosomal protein S18 acetylase RimI-like enzyme
MTMQSVNDGDRSAREQGRQMEGLALIYEPFPSHAVEDYVERGVINHNFAATGQSHYSPVGYFLKNQRGEYLGGLTGYTWGNWLQVRFLWVAPSLRNRGHGTRLMDAAEDFALQHECGHATLETHSFQALGFYQKRGYTIAGQLDDYPPGHAKYFLRKTLVTRAAATNPD